MLIDGLLAKQGLLDGAAVASALAPANLARGFGYIRLMQLVDTEACPVMVRERSRARLTTPRAARAFPSIDHTRPPWLDRDRRRSETRTQTSRCHARRRRADAPAAI